MRGKSQRIARSAS